MLAFIIKTETQIDDSQTKIQNLII
jgi:hypothetical protein